MNAIKNITIGHTERLYKPVGYTMLANLVNIIPFCLSIEAVRRSFLPPRWRRTTARHGKTVVHFRHIGCLYAGDGFSQRASYRANFRGAYEMSASGRIALAEHLRKLSLGFLSRRRFYPAIFPSMLVTDFTMARRAFPTICPN